ncbi:MAG: Ig-like domain-containing protein [Bacteroidales bacterium]|nr:Ig-like domain-containing protein [Bacteroidales bacterium]
MQKILTLLSIATFAIIVTSCKKKVDVTDVTLNQTSIKMTVGDNLQLEATVHPYNATLQTMSWESSNNSVARVNNGRVVAIDIGLAAITVTTRDGDKKDTCFVTVTFYGCNTNTPGWGSSLGTITRDTNEWTISGNGITQIWSDAVTASSCDKERFVGGEPDSFNADCRSNPDYPGDLFSWCAVVRFQNLLCPAPWRVPTTQDFIDLDIALGGTGFNTGFNNTLRNRYFNDWGGAYKGLCSSSGALNGQGSDAFYWSQAEYSADYGYHLTFNSFGAVYPQGNNYPKHYGFTLRCVR